MHSLSVLSSDWDYRVIREPWRNTDFFLFQYKILILQNLEWNQRALNLFIAAALGQPVSLSPCMSGELGLPRSHRLKGPSFLALNSVSLKVKEPVSPRSTRNSQKSCWEDRQANWQAQLSWKAAWIPLEIGQKWKFSCETFWFQWMAYPDEEMCHQKFSSQIVLCWT